MLEQLKYKNHQNEVFEFGKDGIYVNVNELHDYEWAIDKKNEKIAALTRKLTKKKLPVTIICATEEEGIAARNRLYEVVEKDVLAMQPGQIILGDYYYKCYVTKSQKKNFLSSKHYMTLTLTLTSDFPYWIKETKTVFASGQVSAQATSEAGLDYPHDYPHDFFKLITNRSLENSGFVASNFRLIVYGVCTNPSVAIGGHVYQVDCTVGDGEYLTIDSAEKKIYVTGSTGDVRNVFNSRNRNSYIFEKIPPGSNVVAWDGSFGFDVIILDERSEPKWT